MELSKQVVSLELAKKLKELGVKQESLFIWVNDAVSDEGWEVMRQKYRFVKTCAAFTVAELGEMLPAYVQVPYNEVTAQLRKDIDSEDNGLQGVWLSIDKSQVFNDDLGEEWSAVYGDNGSIVVETTAKTIADAMAKMLIYLIENKLSSTEQK